MISYYTVLIILCWIALGVLCILVHENSWIYKEDKHLFYLTYGIVALSALAEWLGVQLNGNTAVPVWVLSAVKCIDYILTPMAGGAIVAQMKLKNRIFKVIKIVLGCNAVFGFPNHSKLQRLDGRYRRTSQLFARSALRRIYYALPVYNCADGG